jgi:hypothetical protein
MWGVCSRRPAPPLGRWRLCKLLPVSCRAPCVVLCVVHTLSSVATEEVSLYTQTWNEFANTARKKRALERGEAVSPSHARA